MIFTSSLAGLNLKDGILTIGNFDGVHIGHQLLLNKLKASTERSGKAAIVISFFPPAKLLLRGGKFLSSRSEKRSLLETYKPDAIVMIPFDHDYAQLSKDVFTADLARLEPNQIIIGQDFRFGNRREGSIDDLKEISKSLQVVDLVYDEKGPISSSRIRQLIEQAKVEEAARLLGRNYSAVGLVVKGQQRGRTIGFPTANTQTAHNKALPPGVFAVTVETSYGNFQGMANVGNRPSFSELPAAVEAHLFDFDEDLYEQRIKVNFHHLIRKEKKFASIQELKRQLELDKQTALLLLNDKQELEN